jgi:hypothetical protein
LPCAFLDGFVLSAHIIWFAPRAGEPIQLNPDQSNWI